MFFGGASLKTHFEDCVIEKYWIIFIYCGYGVFGGDREPACIVHSMVRYTSRGQVGLNG